MRQYYLQKTVLILLFTFNQRVFNFNNKICFFSNKRVQYQIEYVISRHLLLEDASVFISFRNYLLFKDLSNEVFTL